MIYDHDESGRPNRHGGRSKHDEELPVADDSPDDWPDESNQSKQQQPDDVVLFIALSCLYCSRHFHITNSLLRI